MKKISGEGAPIPHPHILSRRLRRLYPCALRLRRSTWSPPNPNPGSGSGSGYKDQCGWQSSPVATSTICVSTLTCTRFPRQANMHYLIA